MNGQKRPFLFFLPVLIFCASIGCGGSFLPAGTELPFPAVPPTPSMKNEATGSSPLSGDWNVQAEFGRLAFTVDPNGTNVTTIVIGVSNWTCGGTTLTTKVQVISQSPIQAGRFSATFNLSGTFHYILLEGAYDEAGRKFAGSWQEHAHGSICSGVWESTARK